MFIQTILEPKKLKIEKKKKNIFFEIQKLADVLGDRLFNFMEAQIPKSIRKLRSCILCGLIETTDYWAETDECPNCNFQSHGKHEKYTSASFTGVIAVFDPSKSWCASWERFNNNIPGLYALNNEGEVTDDMVEYLLENQRAMPEWVERYKLAHEK